MLRRGVSSLLATSPFGRGASTLVLTVTGTDKSGIMGDISSAVEAANSTIVEQKVTRLCGDFASILKVNSNSPSAERALTEALTSKGYTVKTRHTQTVPKQGIVRKITLRQHRDSKSINPTALTKAVTDYLCGVGIKVDSFDSSTNSQGLLEMNGILRLPADFRLSTFDLVQGLNKTGTHVNYLDLEVGP